MAAFLSTLPPQVAITGLGCEVKNVVWSHLSAGRGGGEHLLVLGKTSTEGSQEPPANPPASKRTLSSVFGRASVEGPGHLCVNQL